MVPFLRRGVNDPQVWPRLLTRRPKTEADEQAFVEAAREGDDVHFAVYADGEPAGLVSVEDVDTAWGVGELGYWIVPERQGQGYGREAASLAVSHAFDNLRLDRVTAPVLADNDLSRRLLEGLGFRQEGTLRRHAYGGGERVDVVVYGALAEEWDDT